MDRVTDFSINDLAAKCRSKSEVYQILATEGGVYLPPMQDATQKYLRDLLRGHKLYIKWKEVKLVHVPQYKGLRVKEILIYAKTKVNISRYLPDYEYNKDPNRIWLWNVVNSLIPDDFKEFINDKVIQRKEALIKSQNLCVNVKPEFLTLFKTSQAISLFKGKSHFLARQPKKTNDKIKIEEYEEEKLSYDKKVLKLEQEIDRLHGKCQDLIDINEADSINAEKLDKLYQLGLIDENGNPIDNDMK